MKENIDSYVLVNPILRKVMLGIYNGRTAFPERFLCSTRLERVNDQFYCQLFFLSSGCSHDAQGGCTMCNYGYGKSHTVDYDAMLLDLREQVRRLPSQLKELSVVPIGSMLDEREVPKEILEKTLEILSAVSCEEFTFETRADTVNAQTLQILSNHIRADSISIELGVESKRAWCLRNCVNKNMSFQTVKVAIDTIHAANMQVCANVGIGFPFVNERYSVQSAIDTIRTLFSMKAERVALFAYNIRPGTLFEWIWKRGLYQCVSLWTVPEVLSHFSDKELRRIETAWYRNFYEDHSKILRMPRTCGDCEPHILSLLDEFRNYPGQSTLAPILDFSCHCNKEWHDRFQEQVDQIEWERVERLYQTMAAGFQIPADEMEKELAYMKTTLA